MLVSKRCQHKLQALLSPPPLLRHFTVQRPSDLPLLLQLLLLGRPRRRTEEKEVLLLLLPRVVVPKLPCPYGLKALERRIEQRTRRRGAALRDGRRRWSLRLWLAQGSSSGMQHHRDTPTPPGAVLPALWLIL